MVIAPAADRRFAPGAVAVDGYEAWLNLRRIIAQDRLSAGKPGAVSAKACEIEGHDEFAAFLQIGLRGVAGQGRWRRFSRCARCRCGTACICRMIRMAERKTCLDQSGMDVFIERHHPAMPDAPRCREFLSRAAVDQMRRESCHDGPADDDALQLAARNPPPISSMMCRTVTPNSTS